MNTKYSVESVDEILKVAIQLQRLPIEVSGHYYMLDGKVVLTNNKTPDQAFINGFAMLEK